MKNHLSFLLVGIVLCFKDFVESEDINCEIKEGVNVCKFQYILISVESNDDYTTISDDNIFLIMPRAFTATKTINVVLNFAKGPLQIEPESFKGLEEIISLDLSSEKSTITLNKDTFLYIPKLKDLKMTLSEATTTLSNKFKTLEELKLLTILGGNLDIIKNDTFTSANNKLLHLQISSCSICFIEPKTFVNLTNLQSLDLSNNSLMGIAPGTFDGLSNLTILNLQKNNIYKIKEATLNELVSLYYFDIHDNDLTDMSKETFYNTKGQHLYLQNNRLKIIRKELFNYTNSKLINGIFLQNNYIDHIDKGAFAGLNLDYLHLSKNKLQVITKEIFQGCSVFVESNDDCEEQENVKISKCEHILTSVETNDTNLTISDESISLIIPYTFNGTRTTFLTLNFAEGPLTIAPESFKGLETITSLDLSSKKSKIILNNDTFLYTPELETLTINLNETTTTLSNKFETLKKLRQLTILGGHLEIIKNDTFTLFSANDKLEYLQISSCSIFLIETKTFANLINLGTLDLSNNSLMKLAPGTFDGLSKLGVLNLQKNNIYKIQEATLNELVNLNYFDISENDLTEISNETFYDTKIERLFLQNNRLKIIQKELFNYTNSALIREIDLDNNYIGHIDNDAFAGLNLDALYLSDNKLRVITKGIFRGCSRIDELDFSGNSISQIYKNAFKGCNISKIMFSGEELEFLGNDQVYWGLSSSTNIVLQ
ncbi:hypothetical protein HCN44_007635 [Aphidius gifuensis]|uniref:Uncharacterized protein n=1 Tax=Aphidius gifuensis TaxID=684658 RepID=A0A834XNU2_APHGI|nr:hypothetical protein HCN44_007635 [Aphidius gifuensis]